MLSMLANLLKVLNSESAPGQVALGFALALYLGLTPFFSLHNVIILFVACMVRLNLSAFFLATAVFTLIAYLIDPLSVSFGHYLLSDPGLEPMWTALYQSDVWRAFKFNHTLLLGSAAIASMLFIPTLVISRYLIAVYRERFMAWFEQLRIFQLVKASKFFTLYEKLGD